MLIVLWRWEAESCFSFYVFRIINIPIQCRPGALFSWAQPPRTSSGLCLLLEAVNSSWFFGVYCWDWGRIFQFHFLVALKTMSRCCVTVAYHINEWTAYNNVTILGYCGSVRRLMTVCGHGSALFQEDQCLWTLILFFTWPSGDQLQPFSEFPLPRLSEGCWGRFAMETCLAETSFLLLWFPWDISSENFHNDTGKYTRHFQFIWQKALIFCTLIVICNNQSFSGIQSLETR